MIVFFFILIREKNHCVEIRCVNVCDCVWLYVCVCVCVCISRCKQQRGGEIFIVWVSIVSIVFVYEKNDRADDLG